MAAKPGKPNAALQARIKRMMQSDEDVGKVAKASPVLIGEDGCRAAAAGATPAAAAAMMLLLPSCCC